MKCYDKMSGERFEADGETEIEDYLRDALTPGETVAYDVDTEDGDNFSGEVTGK